MDISDNYFDSQQPPQTAQQQTQQHIIQGQQCNTMQCDAMVHNAQQMDEVHAPLSGPLSLPTPSQNCDKMHAASNIDLDSLLLHQFSRLGTRDHDELVEQFHNLMNNQMNKDAARFFLEMSNWNLQTAIGCYLDFYSGNVQPSMKIVYQTQTSNRQMIWRLQNNGNEDWPNGCYLMSNSQMRRIELPVIKPGETCELIADISTNEPIIWRLCAPHGEYFGDKICLVPPGMFNSNEELNYRLAQLAVTDQNPAQCPQIHIVISERMES